MADARDRVAADRLAAPVAGPAGGRRGRGRPVAGGIGNATLRAIASTASPAACTRSTRTPTRSRGVPAYPTRLGASASRSTWSSSPFRRPRSRTCSPTPARRRPGRRGPHRPASARWAAARGQAELVRIARRHGIRLVGPNCLGVLNTDPRGTPRRHVPAGAAPGRRPRARVPVGRHRHRRAGPRARTGAGISSFVSLGNKADVSGNDLLSYWFDDPATSAVALYLESFGNPRRFARIARAAGPAQAGDRRQERPVGGRSASRRFAHRGRRLARRRGRHAFAQAGVIRVDHLGELLDTARMVTDQPLPAGRPAGDRRQRRGRQRAGRRRGRGGRPAGAGRERRTSGAARTRWSRAPATRLTWAQGQRRKRSRPRSSCSAASGEADAVIVVVAATRANDVRRPCWRDRPESRDRHRGPAGRRRWCWVRQRRPVSASARLPVFDLPERAVAALAQGGPVRGLEAGATRPADRPV